MMTLDITNRKRAEEEMRRKKELLKIAERIARLGSWEWNVVQNSVTWSDELFSIFEIDKEKYGQDYSKYLSIIHPEDKDFVLKAVADAVRRRYGQDINYRLLFPDGRVKFVHEQAALFFDESGNHIRTIGTIHDITWGKTNELLVLQSERQYHQLVDNIPDGLVLRDVSGQVVYFNRQFLDILEIDEEEQLLLSVVGKNEGGLIMPSIYTEKSKRLLVEAVSKQLDGENVAIVLELEGKRKNGTQCWFESKITVVKDNDILIGSQALIRDITSPKNAERQLEVQFRELKKINAELDRFVYSASHELRGPLMTLSGLIDLSLDDPIHKDLPQFLKMMGVCVERLDNTIRNILEYSRNARTEMLIQEIDIENLIETYIQSHGQANADIKVNFSSEIKISAPFYSDRFRLTAIVSNLLNNAFRFHRANETKPFVQFLWTSDAEEGVFSIVDNGEGIPVNKQDRIFDIFYRNSSKSMGAGLGLYICREMVSILGGKIEVNSVAGQGSTFTVRLPNLSRGKKP